MRNLFIALTAVFVCGCFMKMPGSGNSANGSFLENTSEMTRIPGTANSRLFVDQSFKLKGYDKVIIEPIVVSLDKNSQTQAVNPEALATLTRHFRHAFINEIKPYFIVVNNPAPGVLRIRAAVVNIKLRNGSGKGKGAVVADRLGENPLDLTNANIEAEFVDSSNNIRMVAVIDRQVGRIYKQPSSTWQHARETFAFWTREMLRRMQ